MSLTLPFQSNPKQFKSPELSSIQWTSSLNSKSKLVSRIAFAIITLWFQATGLPEADNSGS